MKKILAVVFAIAVMMSLAATAFAAGGPAGFSGQMPGNFQNGQGPMNGQPPEMNGEAPEMNGQPPEMNGEAPEMNGQPPFEAAGFIDFEAMVSDGVLSEDTYESILAYMEENKPEDLPEMNGQPPEMNGEAPEMNGQPPMMNGEAPDGEAPEDLPERPEMDGENAAFGGILEDLLNDGIITEEEYEALLAALEE
ncbi:MAG: SHOCT domain-containing protein [Oscillospiraceae bacterium]|nr:SHOCT domain-containing protein [Oscillospiraceae bacterium]